MRKQPGATFEWLPIEVGETGLVGTLAVAIDDGEGTTVFGPTTDDIIEIDVAATPSGTYVATLVAPDDSGQYLLLASTDGSFDPDTVLTEELEVTSSAPDDIVIGDTYADVEELFRILKIRSPSAEQTTAGERVLFAAATEINAEIDLDDDTTLTAGQLAIAAQVNLRRAEELWHEQEAPMGLIGLGSEFGATHLARNSWDKHAYTLAPLKDQFGLA